MTMLALALSQSAIRSAAGAAVAAPTWNPLDKSAAINLTGGDLVATLGSITQSGVRATASKSAGTPSFTAVITTGSVSTTRVGLANSTWSLTATGAGVMGGNVNSLTITSAGIIRINNATVLATGVSFVLGDTLELKPNFDLGFFFFRNNGGNWNGDPTANPATGVGGASLATLTGGGPWFPAFGSGATGQTCTADFTNWV